MEKAKQQWDAEQKARNRDDAQYLKTFTERKRLFDQALAKQREM